MVYYKQAVADTEKTNGHNYGSKACEFVEFQKTTKNNLKMLLTNRKQHDILSKLSLKRTTANDKRTLIIE